MTRRRGLLALGLLALAAPGWVRFGRGSELAADPVVVKREALVTSVDVEGELSAVRSTEIGPPPVVEAEFKIAFLAPEGSAVKKGEPILGFDTEVLTRELAAKQAELEEAVKKVEQKQIEFKLKLLELDQLSAQANADLGKATLKTEVPADVQQRIELEKARLDQQGRARDLQNLDAERRSTQLQSDSELRSLTSQRDRARGRVQALESAIDRMMVKAPQGGIVVHTTDWKDEKKKVGDSVWSAEMVLSLPDLSEMRGDGAVDEADGGALAEGQRVTLRLEARPDLDLLGRVGKVGRTVRQMSRRNPAKVFRTELVLDRTDPTLMRPAMRFRGEIETGRVSGLLLVPRDAVFLREGGPVVFVHRLLGWRETSVRLGLSNRRQVEILEGLSEGDHVSRVELKTPRAERRLADGRAP